MGYRPAPPISLVTPQGAEREKVVSHKRQQVTKDGQATNGRACAAEDGADRPEGQYTFQLATLVIRRESRNDDWQSLHWRAATVVRHLL
jgi:hypothetical protein